MESNAIARRVVVYTNASTRLTPEDVEIETYASLARVAHRVERCARASSSPSSSLPCVAFDDDITSEDVEEKHAKRHALARFRKDICDIDDGMKDDERERASAARAAASGALRDASEYFTYVDDRGYAKAREAKTIVERAPWPIERALAARVARDRGAGARARGTNARSAIEDAKEAYESIDALLRRSRAECKDQEQYWLCGSKPRSCDAAVYAQLRYHATSPSCELAREEMKKFPRLVQYVNDVSERLVGLEKMFRDVAGPPPIVVDASAWGDGYDARERSSRDGGKPRAKKVELSEKDRDMRRKAWISVGVALSSVLTYLIAGGIVSIDLGADEDEASAEGDDAGGDDAEDEDDDESA